MIRDQLSNFIKMNVHTYITCDYTGYQFSFEIDVKQS